MASKRQQWNKDTQAHFSKCLHILKALHYSDLNKPHQSLSASSSSRKKRASKELDEEVRYLDTLAVALTFGSKPGATDETILGVFAIMSIARVRVQDYRCLSRNSTIS